MYIFDCDFSISLNYILVKGQNATSQNRVRSEWSNYLLFLTFFTLLAKLKLGSLCEIVKMCVREVGMNNRKQPLFFKGRAYICLLQRFFVKLVTPELVRRRRRRLYSWDM